VANDMSKPLILKGNEIFAQDMLNRNPVQGTDFILNILLPLLVYIVSIGGFSYLLIEDFKMLKSFSHHNKLARYVWCLWIMILICLLLIPVFFGIHMLVNGFSLAVITTIVFLMILGILYRFR
jgi:amino acid transporter